jgi:programmed cell death 6-interacting protein
MEILDHEASEDEKMRSKNSLTRLPSHEANSKLVEKAQQYRSILEKASKSDELVRNKWDDWEANITQLTWQEVRDAVHKLSQAI